MQTYQKLDIEINAEINDIITAVQNDTKSRYLDIQLFNNGTAINLTDHKVRVYGFKADKKDFWNDCTIEDATTGRVLLELTTQMLALADVIHLQLKIYNNEETEILSTQIFKVWGTKDLFNNDAVESSNEYGSVVNLFQDVFDVRMQIKEIVDKIGDYGSIGNELNKKTLFDQLEWLIDFSRKNSVGSLGEKIDNITPKIYTDTNYTYVKKEASNLNLKQETLIFEVNGNGELLHCFCKANFSGETYQSGSKIPIYKFKLVVDGVVVANLKVTLQYRKGYIKIGFLSKANCLAQYNGTSNAESVPLSKIFYAIYNGEKKRSTNTIELRPSNIVGRGNNEQEILGIDGSSSQNISGVFEEIPIKFKNKIQLFFTLLDKQDFVSVEFFTYYNLNK